MTDLAETIERLERDHAQGAPGPGMTVTHALDHADFTLLLATARRVQAMEAVKPHEAAKFNVVALGPSSLTPGIWQSLLDLASDRDAQAAEVERLRAELVIAKTYLQVAETTRDAQEHRSSQAEARVRELETLARKLLKAADLQKRTGHWVAELATAVAIKELTAAMSPEPEEKR